MTTYISNRDSGGLTDEKGHLKFLANSYAGNILDGQKVQESSPTGMSVRVSAGNIRIPYSNYAHMGWSEGFTGVTVATSDPSNPRIDRVVAYVDRSLSFTDSDTNNPNSLKYKAVTGTPNAVPGKPSDAAVQSSVGASNPWCEIGLVRVPATASTIIDAYITDTRVYVTPIYHTDWRQVPAAVTSVSANGQRSYDITVDSDVRGYITPGDRLRTERTTPAPTQSATFNGTTQYYTDSSVAGMAQTDDITVMGWVYPTAYQQGILAARQNGSTDGWYAYFTLNGRMVIGGARVGDDLATSTESIHLNEWQHVAMTIDSSAGVATMYLNGSLVGNVYQNVSNTSFATPTGTLSIGAASNGTSPFAGKMCQVGIFSAVLTAATIKNYMNQGLTGSETNLVSGYSLSNSVADLNTTNANNLTANGSIVATTADSPFGGQGGGTISSVYDYHIVERVTSTVITVQTAEGCTVPTTGGITSLYYSGVKIPTGFPAQKEKWTIFSQYNIDTYLNSFATSTYVNPNTILNVPIGAWSLGWQAGRVVGAVSSSASTRATLSIANNTVGDARLSTTIFAGVGNLQAPARFQIPISMSIFTPYYLNIYTDTGTTGTLGFGGSIGATIIFAENAYL